MGVKCVVRETPASGGFALLLDRDLHRFALEDVALAAVFVGQRVSRGELVLARAGPEHEPREPASAVRERLHRDLVRLAGRERDGFREPEIGRERDRVVHVHRARAAGQLEGVHVRVAANVDRHFLRGRVIDRH